MRETGFGFLQARGIKLDHITLLKVEQHNAIDVVAGHIVIRPHAGILGVLAVIAHEKVAPVWNLKGLGIVTFDGGDGAGRQVCGLIQCETVNVDDPILNMQGFVGQANNTLHVVLSIIVPEAYDAAPLQIPLVHRPQAKKNTSRVNGRFHRAGGDNAPL